MVSPNILCVTLDAEAGHIAQQLLSSGWRVVLADSLATAMRLQAHQRFDVSVLLLGAQPPASEPLLEDCVMASQGSEWLAVCGAAALESPGFRALVLHCFFDHHLLPLDGRALSLMLAHAGQRATLRHQHQTHLHAASVLGMLGQGPAIRRLREQIRKVAVTEAPVLIGGESGSGKELAARAIHQCSQRAAGPFVDVNCGAIAPSLIHSELFGHERGAFTGAASLRHGLIEAANGGTIFLDEIGDLPLELQTSLLRFLQEKTIHRVGASRSVPVDARVVAASHVDLAGAVAAGRFREDLFYRLNVLFIDVPPLRRRLEDVPVLAEHFFQCCVSPGTHRVKGFTRQALAALTAHSWPGNVRELYNRVQRAVVMSDQRLIGPADLGLAPPARAGGIGLDAVRNTAERDAICLTLTRVGRNVTHAARELGISRMTLYRLMDKYSIVQGAE